VDNDLDEGPGQLVGFVRLGLIAGAHLDHQIAHADALARVETQIAGQAIALVQHADHRDTIGHRGRAGQAGRLGTDRAFHRR
jgi:hypothetical protein